MAKLIQNIFENKLQVGGALVPPLRPAACHPANPNPSVPRWPSPDSFCSPLTVVVVLFVSPGPREGEAGRDQTLRRGAVSEEPL